MASRPQPPSPGDSAGRGPDLEFDTTDQDPEQLVIRLTTTRSQDLFEKNGFAMNQEKSFRDVQVSSSEIGIRTIGLNDLWQSLKEGYDDFSARPTVGMVLTVLLYLLFALLLTLFLVGGNLLHLAFPIVAGFTLIGPVVSIGLIEMSRRRERGLDVGWRSTFDFVHSASFAPILALSVVMMLLYVAWLFTAQFLYFGLFRRRPASLGVRLCDPISYDPTGHGTDSVWRSSRVHICVRCARNFGGRIPVAPGQTGKRRYSGRHFDQSNSFQCYGDGGLGSDCCRAAGCGGNRVFDRPRGGPANTGPCNVASLPQSR